MSDTLPLFASCQPGLEPLLRAELDALGLAATEVPGGAEFAGDVADVQRACLWLGTASHVRVRLARFRCRALGELLRKAAELPFRDWLVPNTPIALTARARRSRIYHTGAIVERVQKAIAAALGATPPEPAPDDDEAVAIAVRFDDDVCTISLDATGTPLHRRGYRLDGRKAPLREDLAHALVLAGGHDHTLALLDPFCGSGTIAIEAAGHALDLPPGRLRPPALLHTARFDEATWHRIRAARPPRAADRVQPIFASDRDEGAVAAARANAERAGVTQVLRVEHHALAAQPWLQARDVPAAGVVATNPPFGRRVRGKGATTRNPLLPLYQTLGHRVAQLGNPWRVAVLAHDVRLARRTGLPLRPSFTTRHGGLGVTAMCGPATSHDEATATEERPT